MLQQHPIEEGKRSIYALPTGDPKNPAGKIWIPDYDLQRVFFNTGALLRSVGLVHLPTDEDLTPRESSLRKYYNDPHPWLQGEQRETDVSICPHQRFKQNLSRGFLNPAQRLEVTKLQWLIQTEDLLNRTVHQETSIKGFEAVMSPYIFHHAAELEC